ncbi:MAG: 1-deoxy-D-xylulose-5-phosphate reductoisomerase, partial [Cyanobacteria bacterium J06628_3]
SKDNRSNPNLDDILAADKWARQEVIAAANNLQNAPTVVSMR